MGKGNGLKSFQSSQKHQAKLAAENKNAGGGASGLASRTESKEQIFCTICRAPFKTAKMTSSMKTHWETKHPSSEFSVCFPGITL